MIAADKNVFLIMLAAAFAVTANADIIPVQLSTIGAFTGQHPGLNFQGVNIPLQNTAPDGSLNIALGTFTLDALANDFSGTFTLTLVFTHPDLIVTGSTQAFTGTYTGTARPNNDTAELLFNPFSTVFNLNGTDGTGSFAFSIDPQLDLSHKERGTDVRSVTLQGHISGAPVSNAAVPAVPEPSSFALCLIPAIALVLFGMRRKLETES